MSGRDCPSDPAAREAILARRRREAAPEAPRVAEARARAVALLPAVFASAALADAAEAEGFSAAPALRDSANRAEAELDAALAALAAAEARP